MPADGYAQASSAEVQNIILQVKGVGCKEDVKSIAASIEKLAGVINCTPMKPGATTKFKVDYDPSITSKDQMHMAIEDTPGCKNPNDRPYKVKKTD